LVRTLIAQYDLDLKPFLKEDAISRKAKNMTEFRQYLH
jgi:hypothetical protein